jgi:hypothetical protein
MGGKYTEVSQSLIQTLQAYQRRLDTHLPHLLADLFVAVHGGRIA